MTTRENYNKSSQIKTEFKPILPKCYISQIQEQQLDNNFINQNLSFSKNIQPNLQEYNSNNQSRFFLESNTYDYYQYHQTTQSQQLLTQENNQLKAKLVQEFHNSQQLQIDINELEYLHNRLKLLINQLKGRITSLEEQNFCLKAENELLNTNLKKSEESRIQLMKQL
ncbi:hypothetical protein RclHR1_03560013 [Rhizophagus clarus]|nr:hypothetical protein RclHR1_03560013 [Rhizophagus clarus]